MIDGNVYANGSGTAVSTTVGSFPTHSAFGAAMGSSPVSIGGIEARGKTGNSWVNTDGSAHRSPDREVTARRCLCPPTRKINQVRARGHPSLRILAGRRLAPARSEPEAPRRVGADGRSVACELRHSERAVH